MKKIFHNSKLKTANNSAKAILLIPALCLATSSAFAQTNFPDGVNVGSMEIINNTYGTPLKPGLRSAGDRLMFYNNASYKTGIGMLYDNGLYMQAQGSATAPLLQLWSGTDAAGDISAKYTFTVGGNVGIGTATPSCLLDLYHLTPKITLTPAGYSGSYKTSLGTMPGAQAFLIFGNNAQNEIRAGNTGVGGYLDFFTNNTVDQSVASDGNLAMRLAANGNVSIGTTDSKGYKLAVAGNAVAESVTVKMRGNWPDYVFAKDYSLPTLQETEKYIKEKGHLPDIPSAEEVKANGIDLGEMNAKLLQKIEELTLHLIEKDKEIKALLKDVATLKKDKSN